MEVEVNQYGRTYFPYGVRKYDTTGYVLGRSGTEVRKYGTEYGGTDLSLCSRVPYGSLPLQG